MSLGLSKPQLYLFVIFPQALRGLVPNIINLSMRMIMTTALVSLIGVTEVLKVGLSERGNMGLCGDIPAVFPYMLSAFAYFAQTG